MTRTEKTLRLSDLFSSGERNPADYRLIHGGRSKGKLRKDYLGSQGGLYAIRKEGSDAPPLGGSVMFNDSAESDAASFDVMYGIADEEYTESLQPSKSNMIQLIEYAPQKRVMRVTFVVHNSKVVYGNVPASIFAQLVYTNQMGRSVGGMFWNLVRQVDRGGLPFPSEQGIRELWKYGPNSGSRFQRPDSKFPYRTIERGYTLGQPAIYTDPTGSGSPVGPLAGGMTPMKLTRSQLQSIEDRMVADREALARQGGFTWTPPKTRRRSDPSTRGTGNTLKGRQ